MASVHRLSSVGLVVMRPSEYQILTQWLVSHRHILTGPCIPPSKGHHCNSKSVQFSSCLSIAVSLDIHRLSSIIDNYLLTSSNHRSEVILWKQTASCSRIRDEDARLQDPVQESKARFQRQLTGGDDQGGSLVWRADQLPVYSNLNAADRVRFRRAK